MAYLVQCNTCKTRATISSAADPDSAVVCGCCPEDHHHGQAANACPRTHAGLCGRGVAGCTVCRPVTIIALPDSAALAASAFGEV